MVPMLHSNTWDPLEVLILRCLPDTSPAVWDLFHLTHFTLWPCSCMYTAPSTGHQGLMEGVPHQMIKWFTAASSPGHSKTYWKREKHSSDGSNMLDFTVGYFCSRALIETAGMIADRTAERGQNGRMVKDEAWLRWAFICPKRHSEILKAQVELLLVYFFQQCMKHHRHHSHLHPTPPLRHPVWSKNLSTSLLITNSRQHRH